MPRATVDTTVTKHYDLKTCPPDGYVEIRKMAYGQKLERLAMVTNMTVKAERTKGQRKKGRQDFEGQLNMAQAKVAEFEFKHCIAGHNLEDDKGRLLNFSLPRDVALLDPQIGEEIGTYIDELNQFNAEDDDDEEESDEENS